MTDRIDDILLIGGGLAAATTAETLRTRGYDGHLTVVTDEPHAPYERPPLSKQVLTGDADPATTAVHPTSFYTDHDIDLITADTATTIDRHTATVALASGTELHYDRLLLATGARPRSLRLSDQPLQGIHTLRSLDDAVHLRDDLRNADHVTIIGAGWIGCETAAAARTLGVQVALVDPLEAPLQRVLGDQVGAVFADLHRSHGVDLRLGIGVSRARGTGRAEQVVLDDGTTIDTDLVVIGIGVTPRTELAAAAGLDVYDGIRTDATLATSDPHVWAAGDVANAYHPHLQTHLRVEHWANAKHQGATAGANMLGAGEPHDRLPYFFSDQYELGMEYVGHAATWDRVVIRGEVDTGAFLAFWLTDGRVTAAMHVNTWDVTDQLRDLVGARTPVDAARLTDPDLPLASATT